MTCDTDHAVLSAYHDGELPEPERAEVEVHVRSCAVCRGELEQLRAVSALFAGARTERAPDALARRVSEPDRQPVAPRAWRARVAATLAGALLYAGAAWSLGFAGRDALAPQNDVADPLRAAWPLLAENAPPPVARLESFPEMQLLSEVLADRRSR